MKIFIDDGMQLKVGTGIGKYTKYLIEALVKMPDVEIEVSDYEPRKGTQIIERGRYLKYINSKKFQQKIHSFDAVHFTNYVIPFRKSKNIKYVVTIHDLVAFLYPKTLPITYRIYNQFMIRYALKHADMIFTVSNSVKNEIMQLFPKTTTPINVTYNGVVKEISRVSRKTYENTKLEKLQERKFFLFVGTVEKRKNVGLIIEAFLKLRETYSESKDFKLVLAGREGFGCDCFHAIVDISKYRDDVIFTGYISDSDRNLLYNNAAAFVFPTIYEGFGVPQVECMACDLPVILSDIPVNREVSKEYGEFFELNSLDSLVEKMMIFVDNKYDMQKKKMHAEAYLKEYNWDLIAQKYINNICTLK